ncbi:MAG: hypothetical protein M3406_05610 [Chloroflexota bacterium]|nr:hypothetical protein [Chloroflexota bacterium]
MLCKINPRINRVWMVREPSCNRPQLSSTEYLVLRARDRVLARYLQWYLSSPQFRSWIELAVEGATGSHTRAKSGPILEQVIPVPPVREQAAMVSLIEEQFSRLQDADRSLGSARRRVEQLMPRVINAATSGYQTKALGELIREPLRNGHSAKRSTTGNIPVFTLTAVTTRDFSERNTKLTDADERRVADLWAEPGDIFIERSNTPELVGTAALYKGQTKRAVFPDLLIRVRVGKEILPEFVEIALRSTSLRRYFQRTARGIAGSMPKIDQGAVLAAEVPIPPIDEQTGIVAEVERQLTILDSVGTAISSAFVRAEHLRRAILGRAFAGRLVPQKLDDEPASELLDRLKAEGGLARTPHARGGRVGMVRR